IANGDLGNPCLPAVFHDPIIEKRMAERIPSALAALRTLATRGKIAKNLERCSHGALTHLAELATASRQVGVQSLGLAAAVVVSRKQHDANAIPSEQLPGLVARQDDISLRWLLSVADGIFQETLLEAINSKRRFELADATWNDLVAPRIT